jgi:peptidoglycan-associated lipoprotein
MQGSWTSRAYVVAAMGLALVVSACSEKPKVDANLAQQSNLRDNINGPVVPGSPREFAVRVGDTVYFETDSDQLTADAQSILRGQAQWLRQYPQYTIMIEGHADERGTREYNLALGAKRAATVRAFLAQSGVDAARMRTISYGKERPVEVCNDISCWSKNRRSQTVLNRRSSS